MTDHSSAEQTLNWPRPHTESPKDTLSFETPDALAAGTRLDEFEITRILGSGGFGIVYLALDHVLLRYVAIKEYMPAVLARRVQGDEVVVRAPNHAETYVAGLESFFNEARMLASFDHPSLVKVHRFWKANGTAYMAMQYYPGQTLREARREMDATPDEARVRSLVFPLLEALELLHDEGIYHRDIAPDNILLLPDGRPVLLDFGSARQVIGDRTQSLTAILKPNFAPIEQYAEEPGMRQGPWTDLYALGATLHFMLTGDVPAPAVMRAVRDTLPPLSGRHSPQFAGMSEALLEAIDWTLALAPENRPQGIATLRKALDGRVATPARAASLVNDATAGAFAAMPTVTAVTPSEEVQLALRAPALSGRSWWATAAVAGAVVVLAALWLATIGRKPNTVSPVAALSADPAVQVVAAMPPPDLRPGSQVQAPTVQDKPEPQAQPPVQATKPEASTSSVSIATAPSHEANARPSQASHAQATRTSTSSAVSAAAKRPADAPSPQPSPEPPRSTPATATSPKKLCGDLNFVSMALCVSRQCLSPALQNHPECVEARRYDEQRRRRMEQQ